MSQVNFEAVKVSYRQTKDGMVVAFAIHPNDAPGELATLKLGTRLMLAWAAINDDETTNPVGGFPPESAAPSETADAGTHHHDAAPAGQKHKRERTPAERAGILCADPRFQRWYGAGTEEEAAIKMRGQCGVKSRAHLTTDAAAHAEFSRIERAYYSRNDPPILSEEERYAAR